MSDGVPEEILAVQLVADKTAKQGRKVTEIVLSKLNDPEVSKKIRDFPTPVSVQAAMDESGFSAIIGEVIELCEKYRSGEMNLGEVNGDILKLAALLAYMGANMNHLKALATNAESMKKQAVQRAILAIKDVLDDESLRVNKEIVEAIASTHTEDQRREAMDTLAISSTVEGFYFGAKLLCEMMDKAAQREFRERFLPQ